MWWFNVSETQFNIEVKIFWVRIRNTVCLLFIANVCGTLLLPDQSPPPPPATISSCTGPTGEIKSRTGRSHPPPSPPLVVVHSWLPTVVQRCSNRAVLHSDNVAQRKWWWWLVLATADYSWLQHAAVRLNAAEWGGLGRGRGWRGALGALQWVHGGPGGHAGPLSDPGPRAALPPPPTPATRPWPLGRL